nr:hypothetical protein [Tanacetum cinerariifolium]
MSVHNSENSDDDVADSVALIKRKNKIGFIDGSCKRSNTDDVLGEQWDRVNAIVLGWILNSTSEELFLDEQMATLISLIKDNKVRKYVQANMAGVNQHMTYIDKELDNIIDISHLKVKDLNLKSVLGIGEQCEGLYYYNDQDPILNALKYSLLIDKRDNNVCCETCQRAKQTKESFSLSDHTSKRLGYLVHLDLWRPYKVTSSEGFRIFFTVVDDYTRAVWVFLIKSKDELKNNSANFFQDVNHINFFDIEYPDISNDDERVANDLNKDKSDSSSTSVYGSNINIADFPVDSGNDADSSDGLVATQNKVATLEENVFFEGNLAKIQVHLKGFKMLEEIDALLRNGTWEMFQLPEGRKAIGRKWIYKIKFRSSDEIDRYKARLVAKGFGQKEGVSIGPKPDRTGPRPIWSKKPDRGPDRNGTAPRQWNAKLICTLIENGFSQSKSNYSLYTKSDKGVFLALLVYVDDIIITGNSISEIEKFKVYLKSKFMIKT